MVSEMDPRLRRGLGEIISGRALLLFGLVLAILGVLPSTSFNAGLFGLAAFAASSQGLAFMLGEPPSYGDEVGVRAWPDPNQWIWTRYVRSGSSWWMRHAWSSVRMPF